MQAEGIRIKKSLTGAIIIYTLSITTLIFLFVPEHIKIPGYGKTPAELPFTP